MLPKRKTEVDRSSHNINLHCQNIIVYSSPNTGQLSFTVTDVICFCPQFKPLRAAAFSQPANFRQNVSSSHACSFDLMTQFIVCSWCMEPHQSNHQSKPPRLQKTMENRDNSCREIFVFVWTNARFDIFHDKSMKERVFTVNVMSFLNTSINFVYCLKWQHRLKYYQNILSKHQV